MYTYTPQYVVLMVSLLVTIAAEIRDEKLLLDGSVHIWDKAAAGEIYWHCRKLPSKECGARAITNNPVQVSKSPKESPHSHAPNQEVKVVEVSASLKHKPENHREKPLMNKTSNSSELWHNRLNTLIGKNHPNLNTASGELQKEQEDVEASVVELGANRWEPIKTSLKNEISSTTKLNRRHSV